MLFLNRFRFSCQTTTMKRDNPVSCWWFVVIVAISLYHIWKHQVNCFNTSCEWYQLKCYHIFWKHLNWKLKSKYAKNFPGINLKQLMGCLFQVIFVLLEFFFWLILRSFHGRWSAANFDLYSARMPIEQQGFFSVPLVLWHETSVYNGHLRRPVKLTPIAERLAVELSLPFFTT